MYLISIKTILISITAEFEAAVSSHKHLPLALNHDDPDRLARVHDDIRFNAVYWGVHDDVSLSLCKLVVGKA